MRFVARRTRRWAVALAVILAGTVFVSVSPSQSFVREGDGGPAAKATIDGPLALAFDRLGNLFIYEGSDDVRPAIREIPAGSQAIRTLLYGCDQNRYPIEKGECLGPLADMHADGRGRLLLTEFADHRVRRLDPISRALSLVAGSGSFGFDGDGGPATAASLQDPRCAAIDQDGNIFVCNFNSRIRRIDARTGMITTIAGTGEPGFGGDQGPASAARLYFPRSVAVDAGGNVFIADSSSNRIRRIDSRTGIIETTAGTGRESIRFDPDFPVVEGPALKADLSHPSNLQFDRQGNLFFINGDTLICRIDVRSGGLTIVAGRGQEGYDGDGGPATRAAIEAWAMALDPSGNIFFADWHHNRIRRVDAATGRIGTFAGNGLPKRPRILPRSD